MNEKSFIYKPLAIVQDKRLTPLEQDYLCLIAQFEKAGGCVASNNYFARYFGVKRPRAVEVIGNLRKKCFIDSSEKKQGGKTIERTLRLIDGHSKKALLSDSKKLLAGLVGSSDFDSNKSHNRTTNTTVCLKSNIFSENSPPLRLSQLLLDLILQRKSDFKRPNLQKWAVHIDRMIRIDHRKPEQIERIIRWSQQDNFWQNNILSTAKLREKFDQLELKNNAIINRGQNGFSKSAARLSYR